MEIMKHEVKKDFLNPFNLCHKAVVKADPSEDCGTELEFAGTVAMKVGYHPAGYGLHYPEVKEYPNGYYVVTWESAKTCE